MSQTKTQSIGTSIVNYLGATIGAISTLFIYPKDLHVYGLLTFIVVTSSLFAPFVELGFNTLANRYFPYFKDPTSGHKGFLLFILIGHVCGAIVFSVLFFLAYDYIKAALVENESVATYFIFIFPVTMAMVFYNMCTYYLINFQKIVVPSILSFFYKLILPSIFLLVVYNYLSLTQAFSIVVSYHFFIVVVCIVYMKYLHVWKLNFDFISIVNAHKREMTWFALFGMATGLSTVLALRTDQAMLTVLLSPEIGGKYNLLVFMSNVCFIPALAITESLNAKIANASKMQDGNSINNYYSRSSILMLISTCWISILIWTIFESLTQVMPNGDQLFILRTTMLCLFVSRIFDAASGINRYIVNYSSYYLVELICMVIMAGLNIVLNLVLIPVLGALGAALATCISVFVYNALRILFVFKQFKMQPFTSKTIGLLLYAALLAVLFQFIPTMTNWILNILFKVIAFTALYFSGIYFLKISQDFNEMVVSLRVNWINKIKSNYE